VEGDDGLAPGVDGVPAAGPAAEEKQRCHQDDENDRNDRDENR
jgi:hypothetical protein